MAQKIEGHPQDVDAHAMDGARRTQGQLRGSMLRMLSASGALLLACAPAWASRIQSSNFVIAAIVELNQGEAMEGEPSLPGDLSLSGGESGDARARPAANGVVAIIGDRARDEQAAAFETESGASGEPESGRADLSAAHRASGPANEARPLGSDAGWLTLGQDQAARAGEDPQESADRADSLAGETGAVFSMGSEAPRMIGSLAIVLAAMIFCAMVLRRFGGLRVRAARPAGVLEVLARYPLGRGHHLILLKLDRRILLLHQSGGAMTALSEVTDHGEVASLLARIEAGTRKSFAHKLQKVLRRSERGEENPFRRYIETVDLTRTQGGVLRALQRVKDRSA